MCGVAEDRAAEGRVCLSLLQTSLSTASRLTVSLSWPKLSRAQTPVVFQSVQPSVSLSLSLSPCMSHLQYTAATSAGQEYAWHLDEYIVWLVADTYIRYTYINNLYSSHCVTDITASPESWDASRKDQMGVLSLTLLNDLSHKKLTPWPGFNKPVCYYCVVLYESLCKAMQTWPKVWQVCNQATILYILCLQPEDQSSGHLHLPQIQKRRNVFQNDSIITTSSVLYTFRI